VCHFYSCLWHVSGIALCPLFSNKYKQKHWRQRTYTANIQQHQQTPFKVPPFVLHDNRGKPVWKQSAVPDYPVSPRRYCSSSPPVPILSSSPLARMPADIGKYYKNDQINNDSRDFTLNTFLSQPSPINRDLVENIHCWHSRVLNLFGSTALTEKQLN